VEYYNVVNEEEIKLLRLLKVLSLGEIENPKFSLAQESSNDGILSQCTTSLFFIEDTYYNGYLNRYITHMIH